MLEEKGKLKIKYNRETKDIELWFKDLDCCDLGVLQEEHKLLRHEDNVHVFTAKRKMKNG